MDTDLFLVIGTVLVAFAIPSLLAAFAESRPPRNGILLALIGGGLISTAIVQNHAGYRFEDLPRIFMAVIGRYIN